MSTDPMVRVGTRAELVEYLRDFAIGWSTLGKGPDYVARYEDAADLLEDRTVDAIHVGHTLYVVVPEKAD